MVSGEVVRIIDGGRGGCDGIVVCISIRRRAKVEKDLVPLGSVDGLEFAAPSPVFIASFITCGACSLASLSSFRI